MKNLCMDGERWKRRGGGVGPILFVCEIKHRERKKTFNPLVFLLYYQKHDTVYSQTVLQKKKVYSQTLCLLLFHDFVLCLFDTLTTRCTKKKRHFNDPHNLLLFTPFSYN